MESQIYNDAFELLENYEQLKKFNKSKPVLSKYEKTAILGARAEQIRQNAKPLIDLVNHKHVTDELEIAELELSQRKIPFIIKRKIGNKFEYWKLEDLHY